MKIKVKILSKSTLNEIKATQEFQYTNEFLDKYKKPGYYIRFTNETTKDTFMLTPNISKYKYSHTPMAIYGYPLDSDNVIDKLLAQRLVFQNSDLIVIYYVNPSDITKVEQLSKTHPDFLDKLKNKFGEDKTREAALKAYKNDKQGYGNIFRYSLDSKDPLNFNSYAGSTFDLSRIYWTILKTVAGSAQQTSFLLSLGIKALDDRSATIDTSGEGTPSQAPEQGLVFNTRTIVKYELFTNPARKIDRKGSGDPSKVLQVNINKFVNEFNAFKTSKTNLKIVKDVQLQTTKNGVVLNIPTPESIKNIFSNKYPQQQLPKESYLKRVISSEFDLHKGSFLDNTTQIHFKYDQDVALSDNKDVIKIEIDLSEEDKPIERSSLYKFFYFLLKKIKSSLLSKPAYRKNILRFLQNTLGKVA